MSTHEPLNIIIPIGGVGSRFAKRGYRYPKPLINIVGRPMLLWLLDCLTLQPDDVVWIAVSEEVDEEFLIGQLVAKHLKGVEHNVLRLRHPTKGASETVTRRSAPQIVNSTNTFTLEALYCLPEYDTEVPRSQNCVPRLRHHLLERHIGPGSEHAYGPGRLLLLSRQW